MFETAGFYKTISENAFTMRLSVLLDILASLLIMAMAIIIYPMIRAFNKRMSIWYIGLYIIYMVTILVSDVYRLSLINLSTSISTLSESVDIKNLGFYLWDSYLQAHFFSLILSAASSSIFYIFLYITKMIPAVLSLWGIIAQLIVITVTWIQIFGIDVDFGFYIQNGVFIMVLILWLLIKGFKEPITNNTKA